MAFSLVNWWAVLVATALNMFMGFLWYGPLFGRLWLTLMDKKPEEIEGGTALAYLTPLLGAVASTVMLAVVIGLLRAYTWWAGAGWGAMLWLAFGGTAILTSGTFEGSRRGLSLLFISYMVPVHALAGAIFAIWR